ncbi:MAG: energy-coupling factor ABC transporter permease [Gammaproteobacteria bacterium]
MISKSENLALSVLPAPGDVLGVTLVLCLPILVLAIRHAPWRRLANPQQLHVFLGSSVALLVLWSIRTHLGFGIEFHLLGLTTVTLAVGWPLAIIAAGIAQLGLMLDGQISWHIFPIAMLANVILPAMVTLMTHRLAQRKLPTHFFVYIFVGAFFGGALAMIMSRFAWVGYALVKDAASGSAAIASLAYLPLMALPEALLNGMLVTLLVVYRPQWVATFDDAAYLQGK